MKHFVDIVRYNVEKITSLDFLLGGISFSPDQIDEYASNWFYKDYLNLDCIFLAEDNNSDSYYYYKDIDTNRVIDSNFITEHGIEYPFIDMHAVLTNGIIRFKKYKYEEVYNYTPLKTKTIISSKYLLNNFDIFKLDNYGSKSMSILFTDYSVLVFDDKGLFILPDKNFALIYNFTDKYVLILLPKTDNDNRKIHIILKPRRLTLMKKPEQLTLLDDNYNSLSKTETTNYPKDDIYEITVLRLYHSDEILPLNLENTSSKINSGRLPDIYTYKEASEEYVDLLSDNVLILFQRAYFKYLNSKYTWYSLDSDTKITVDISDLPISYGGLKFDDIYYIDPGFYKNISLSSYVLSTTDLVLMYENYEDFKIFKSSAGLLSFIEDFIKSGRNILDLDIFDDRGYKFIQYCHSPISTIDYDYFLDEKVLYSGEKFYVYKSNVNSKKIKMKYTIGGDVESELSDYVYKIIEELKTTEYDENYFNTDSESFSIKWFIPSGSVDVNTHPSGFAKIYVPTINNGNYLIFKDEGPYLSEVEYYLASTENKYTDTAKLPTWKFLADDEEYGFQEYWTYELKYLLTRYLAVDNVYQVRTNLEDVFIPSGMSVEKLGLTFSILTIVTPGIKNDNKTLRNNLRSDISVLLEKPETELDSKTISGDTYFSSNYFGTSKSSLDDDILSERIVSATEYLTENNTISITLTSKDKTVRYWFSSTDHDSDDVDEEVSINSNTLLLEDIMTKYSTDEMLLGVLYGGSSDYYNNAEVIKNHILLSQYMRPDIIFNSLVPLNTVNKVTTLNSDPFLNVVLLNSFGNGSGLYEYHNYNNEESLIKYPIYVFCRYTGKDFDTFKKQLRFSIIYKFNIWVMDNLGDVFVFNKTTNNTPIDLNIYNFGLIYCDKFEGNDENVASFYFVEPYLVHKKSDPDLGDGFYLDGEYFSVLLQFLREYLKGATHNGGIPISEIMGILLVSISFENKCAADSGIKILVVRPKDNNNW